MRYRVPPTVAWVVGEDLGAADGVYLVDVREAQPLVLRGTAELIWLVAAEGGDLPEDIEATEDDDVEAVRRQVVEFADTLVARGLLEEAP